MEKFKPTTDNEERPGKSHTVSVYPPFRFSIVSLKISVGAEWSPMFRIVAGE
jgi:hypothetical protein